MVMVVNGMVFGTRYLRYWVLGTSGTASLGSCGTLDEGSGGDAVEMQWLLPFEPRSKLLRRGFYRDYVGFL